MKSDTGYEETCNRRDRENEQKLFEKMAEIPLYEQEELDTIKGELEQPWISLRCISDDWDNFIENEQINTTVNEMLEQDLEYIDELIEECTQHWNQARNMPFWLYLIRAIQEEKLDNEDIRNAIHHYREKQEAKEHIWIDSSSEIDEIPLCIIALAINPRLWPSEDEP